MTPEDKQTNVYNALLSQAHSMMAQDYFGVAAVLFCEAAKVATFSHQADHAQRWAEIATRNYMATK